MLFTPRIRLLSLALVFAVSTTLYGQVDTGTILGTIRDNTGAVVPGATITVRNEGTSLAQTTTSSSSGTYVFTALKIGRYTVEAEHAGFKKEVHSGLELNIQQQMVVDFDLSLGQVTSEVNVTGQAPILQTENGSVGQVIERQEINNLPLNGVITRFWRGWFRAPPSANPKGEV